MKKSIVIFILLRARVSSPRRFYVYSPPRIQKSPTVCVLFKREINSMLIIPGTFFYTGLPIFLRTSLGSVATRIFEKAMN